VPSPEQPRQHYFPRARVQLIVRFEDFATGTPPPAPPAKPPQLRAGKGADASPVLQVNQEGNAFVLVLPGEGRGGTPQQQISSADNRTHVLEGIIPITATLSRNGIRTADTLTLSLRYRDLPIDPRTVRACGVRFVLGTISEDDYVRELGGRPSASTSGATAEDAVPLAAIPDEFTDEQGNSRSNIRFEGWVDDWQVELPEEDEPTVTLECTDNTRLLIEQDAPAKLTVGEDGPIDRAVAEYLANFPQFRGLAVEYRPAGSDVPQLGKALAKTAFRPKLGPAPAGGASGGGGGTAKLSVWDYLTDIAGALGLIVRLEGTTIILQRARTLYSSKFSGRPDDPFTGRILPSGREILRRLFVYGRNILDQEFSRKFTRAAAMNVEVRCYSGKRGLTLVGRHPQKDQRQGRPLPGDASDEKWIVHTVSGIEDEATLRAIAQGIYESLGRSELAVKFTTRDLASYGGGNSDPDLLDLQAGDAVDIEIARDAEGTSTPGQVEQSLSERAAEFLQQLGYEDAFAAAYGAAIGQIGFPSTFRVKTVGFDWDHEEGVQISIECVNYLEVRRDGDLPNGEEVEPSTTASPQPVTVQTGDAG
jgi:hypothetical protein